MKNIPDGFLAAHVAASMDGWTINLYEIVRDLRCGEELARQVKDQAERKKTQAALSRWPRPNHENTLKEINR